MALACFYIANPSPNPNPSLGLPPKKTSTLCSPPSLSHGSPVRPQCHRVSAGVRPLNGLQLIEALHFYRATHSRSIVSYAASHEEPSSEFEFEREKDDVKQSDEGWEEALEEKVWATLKEHVLKLQSVSKKTLVALKEISDEQQGESGVKGLKEALEAYDVYLKKFAVVLEETTDELKIQADKARYDVGVIARELSQEGKQYIAIAAENSPDSLKDVVETFASSTDDINDISQLRDFYVGIPYGAFLSLGGFLNFMVTGSISAIRFGVILGGTLLALSVFSLRSWRKEEPSMLALKAQAVIAVILFLRAARVFSQGRSFTGLLAMLISGAVAAFFASRLAYSSSSSSSSH
ncbi:hypothetical protein Dimus_034820 [Dionaea muscipula]